MSNIFGSSLLYLSSCVILACSPLPYFTLAKWFIATPRGSVMLDCGFSPLMSSLSDKNMRLVDVLLPPGGKQRFLYVLAGARILYFTQSSFNAVVRCFGFTLWVGFATKYQRDVLDRYLKVDDS